MNQVYIRATYDVVQFNGFWRQLRRFIGHFRIEQQTMQESHEGLITISFYTDKVNSKEGELRQVDLECKSNARGSWYFTKINY
jgi:hypothetical protein